MDGKVSYFLLQKSEVMWLKDMNIYVNIDADLWTLIITKNIYFLLTDIFNILSKKNSGCCTICHWRNGLREEPKDEILIFQPL